MTLLLLFFCKILFASKSPTVSVKIQGDQFSIAINGATILSSVAPTFPTALKLKSVDKSTGFDMNGQYSRTTMTYANGYATYISVYGNTLIFGQDWPATKNTSSSNHVTACFPCFQIPTKPELGYHVYKGSMAGSGDHSGKLTSDSEVITGNDVGPLTLFNSDASITMVFSAASRFMSHQTAIANGKLMFGIRPVITSVPNAYRVETILHVDFGINKSIMEWGAFLMTRFSKTRSFADSDFTCNYLGYSTDNGAFYYYKTEDKKDYEQTILDIHAETKLPYRHILLDSWWYYQGVGGGVKEWAPRPDIFPDGMQYVHNATGWQIMAHNRYWAKDTVYAKQNGGEFDFIIEKSKAMPTDDAFWDFLIDQAARWGIVVYEQDWLYNEFDDLTCTQESATLAREWLMQMGRGCENHGLTIQYCMSYPRHMLQSLEIPVVTQARISGDYHPGNDQWIIGSTSLFAHAIGIRGSKDNFWSSQTESGRYGNTTEPHPRLQAVSSILSRGPVYISDEIGVSDVDLIMKTCRQDGTLLQPSKPCTAIDKNFLAKAGFGDLTGEIWSAESVVSTMTFMNLLVANADANKVSLGDLNLEGTHVYYEANTTESVKTWKDGDYLSWPKVDKSTFNYFNIFPVIGSGMAFLGEVDKFVAVSPDRFRSVEFVASKGFRVRMEGSVGEKITIRCYSSTATPSVKSTTLTFDLDTMEAWCSFD